MQIRITSRGSRAYADGCALVRDKYRRSFSADVEPHPDSFVVVRGRPDAPGTPSACAGLTFAEQGKLFSERYLDAPVEELIGAREGVVVQRSDIMEVGSLASNESQAGTELIRSMPMLAWCVGRRYALCTATHQVRGLFELLGMEFTILQAARIDRLEEVSRANWGRYYERQPMTGYFATARMTHIFASSTGRCRLDDVAMNLIEPAQAQETRREAA